MKNIQIKTNRIIKNLKPVNIFAFSVVVIAIMFLVSCSSPTEKVKKSEDKVAKAKEDVKKSKIEHKADLELFRKETERKMVQNDERIAEINAIIINSNNEERKNYEKQISLLGHQNEILKVRAKNYKLDSKDDWETFKSEFNQDMYELQESLRNFAKS
ncbi:MAG: hypothetical protein WED10_05870 [Brumimicrobium sp.]